MERRFLGDYRYITSAEKAELYRDEREFDEKNHVKSAVTSKSREGFLGMKE